MSTYIWEKDIPQKDNSLEQIADGIKKADTAFPFTAVTTTGSTGSTGLSKREYIATQIMASMSGTLSNEMEFTDIAHDAVIAADMLLNQLERTPDPNK